MRRTLLLFSLCALLTLTVHAAEPQSISFPSGTETVHGLLYLPSGQGPHPAIVVIHEWWGLNDWVKQQAADLARQGYVSLAVDLYRGQVATDPEVAHELMRGLPQDRGVRDLLAATSYLAGRKDVAADRIGAVGWCMGGGFAVQLAVADPQLRAVAINYGSLPTDPASIEKIHAAVLGNFGGLDRGITPADVNAFESALKKLNHPTNIKIYPDAGHAFENPNNTAGYRAQDAKDAEQRMTTFFAKTLKR
ncbi:dienelactone hydrolase family protein [Acidipila rosea]|uniref:Carboxymethylenebutenolidase n=1 Tax=Acidipila rosea TaxID=768535 RepID=A0A4R1LAB5_9BACT|nr:dienelactone hydrolase family protein [Acidipila rosea]MBW4027063.1 dienelactone hydrolase family protein [Acidobacteriota bacterium]MBW4045131.1 dienelactone hydrolase family protein [Acidobacteriota bacterium]TCK75366.1 carboxymethylenebutenolidase [Acidipila rosea]